MDKEKLYSINIPAGKEKDSGSPTGILLLGGSGTRLVPLTDLTNKHLLSVYDRPMVDYSVDFLVKSGIKDIIAVTTPDDIDTFARFLGDGAHLGANISYIVQEEALGTAHAIKLCERLINANEIATLWGDNLFEYALYKSCQKPLGVKCRIHLACVHNPQDFGVVEIVDNKIRSIEDKPTMPKAETVCTGFMLFASDVFEEIERIKPNAKGEIDIMDAVRSYNRKDLLEFLFIRRKWLDAGVSFDTLFEAAKMAKERKLNKV